MGAALRAATKFGKQDRCSSNKHCRCSKQGAAQNSLRGLAVHDRAVTNRETIEPHSALGFTTPAAYAADRPLLNPRHTAQNPQRL